LFLYLDILYYLSHIDCVLYTALALQKNYNLIQICQVLLNNQSKDMGDDEQKDDDKELVSDDIIVPIIEPEEDEDLGPEKDEFDDPLLDDPLRPNKVVQPESLDAMVDDEDVEDADDAYDDVSHEDKW